jgi:subtilase family serine protease
VRLPTSLVRVARLRVELFEERTQPSVAHVPTVQTNLVSHPSASGSPGDGLTPAEVRHAYGFDKLANDGAGQTIAIVVAFDNPNIESDLATFDSAFGLAAPPSFNKVKMPGATTDSGWAGETALDVEWAHAMAPKANILLVEARSAATTDLLAAVDYARRQPDVSIVSMSWGGNESSFLASKDSYFTTPAGHVPVTFIAAAGDSGASAEWPASSPNVLAVGGTRVRVAADGSYLGESAWSGSGGGFSRVYSAPTYQSSVVTGHRAVPDVAFDADPNSGVSVYNSVPDQYGNTGWMVVGGTSAGAPQWAGLIALANQQRAAHGLANIGRAQDAIYTLPASAFHDITAGGNGYAARVGYDLVTGRGTPIANLLVPALAGEPPSTTTTTTPPSVGGSTGTSTGGSTTTAPVTGTGATGTGTTKTPTTGITSAPVWFIPISFGWGFGGGLFGWNLGGWSLGRPATLWITL